MVIEKVNDYIENYEISKLVEYVQQKQEPVQEEIKSYLLNQLETCSDHRRRDVLAIALGDLHYQAARDVLIDLIFMPELNMHRGSLVYALERFDCSEHYQKLVPLLFTQGNFEVRMNMYGVMESMFPRLNEQEKKWCMDYVEKQMEEYECMLQQVYAIYEDIMGGILEDEV